MTDYSNKFSASELDTLKQHFNAFDLDGSGAISESELKTVLKRVVGEQRSDADIREMIASVDSNQDGEVQFSEFLRMAYDLKQGGAQIRSGSFQDAYKKVAHAIKIEGAAGSQHSYTEEEKRAFVEHINHLLSDDPHVGKRLPINPDGMQLFEEVKDGVLLCKLINATVPGTIDERVLNLKEKKNAWEVNENHTLCIQSCLGIGCKVVNIGPDDLKEGKVHLVLGLTWQIIKVGLLQDINLKAHPELILLLKPGEQLEDLLKLPAESILIRWVNYHMEKQGCPRRIGNFGPDIKDSVVYTELLNAIEPAKCGKGALNESDLTKRADKMLEEASKMDCRKFVTPRDVVSGNQKLNLAFAANIFNTNSGLKISKEEEKKYAEMMEFDQEGTREQRAFQLWIQSLGLEVTNLFEDVRDGVLLLKIMEKIVPGTISWKSVNMPTAEKPLNKFKKVENANYCVLCAKNMKLNTTTLGGTDIVDGNKKMILGLVWQLMRASLVGMLKEIGGGKEVTDADLIKWANETIVAAGKTSSIKSLKDAAISTGVFFCDLCYAVAPGSVDMSLVTRGESDEEREMNAKYAVSVARKLDATLFLSWEDIVEAHAKLCFTFVASLKLLQMRRTK